MTQWLSAMNMCPERFVRSVCEQYARLRFAFFAAALVLGCWYACVSSLVR